jgi:putative hydrolase of the HAD superfamily
MPMRQITTLFFDVGGVILTNAWDRSARQRAVEHFGIDGPSFEERHALVDSDFETGRMGIDEYLERTAFHVPRSFTPAAFKSFMWAQSQPYPESLAMVAELARSKQYLLATLNNESRELNEYRIERFHLGDYFTAFFSSAFLGVRKPDEKIYQMALEITQRRPDECLFVDDRELNVESARRSGMQAIQFRNPAQLRQDFSRYEG